MKSNGRTPPPEHGSHRLQSLAIVMPKRPNVILRVVEDMGNGDFGVFNDGPAKTAHIDALEIPGVDE